VRPGQRADWQDESEHSARTMTGRHKTEEPNADGRFGSSGSTPRRIQGGSDIQPRFYMSAASLVGDSHHARTCDDKSDRRGRCPSGQKTQKVTRENPFYPGESTSPASKQRSFSVGKKPNQEYTTGVLGRCVQHRAQHWPRSWVRQEYGSHQGIKFLLLGRELILRRRKP